jgi:hypothetical protein
MDPFPSRYLESLYQPPFVGCVSVIGTWHHLVLSIRIHIRNVTVVRSSLRACSQHFSHYGVQDDSYTVSQGSSHLVLARSTFLSLCTLLSLLVTHPVSISREARPLPAGAPLQITGSCINTEREKAVSSRTCPRTSLVKFVAGHYGRELDWALHASSPSASSSSPSETCSPSALRRFYPMSG